MIQIRGKGHEILSFFNIEYDIFIKDITNELMSNPNKKFTLTLEREKKKN